MTLYDKEGAADYLHVSVVTLNRLIATKQISHFKNPGARGRILFSEEQLDEYLETRAVKAEKDA